MLADLQDLARARDSAGRTQLIERLTTLFVRMDDAGRASIIALFEDVVTRVLASVEEDDRVALSGRFAHLPEAPVGILRRFAHDSSRVATDVLRHSPRLADADLMEVATQRTDGHRMSIARRVFVSEEVADTLIAHGDEAVLRTVAANDGAQISPSGYDRLVRDAISDRVLRELVAGRARLPDEVRDTLAPVLAAEVGRRFRDARTRDDQDEFFRVLAAFEDGDVDLDKALEVAIGSRRPIWVVGLLAHASGLDRTHVMTALLERDPRPFAFACKQAGVSNPSWAKLLDFRALGLGIGSNAPKWLRLYEVLDTEIEARSVA
jgi:hypothetical protein